MKEADPTGNVAPGSYSKIVSNKYIILFPSIAYSITYYLYVSSEYCICVGNLL